MRVESPLKSLPLVEPTLEDLQQSSWFSIQIGGRVRTSQLLKLRQLEIYKVNIWKMSDIFNRIGDSLSLSPNYISFNLTPVPIFWINIDILESFFPVVSEISKQPESGQHLLLLQGPDLSTVWQLDWRNGWLCIDTIWEQAPAEIHYLINAFFRKTWLHIPLKHFLSEFKLLMQLYMIIIEDFDLKEEDKLKLSEFRLLEATIPHYGQYYRFLDKHPEFVRELLILDDL